MRLPDPARSRAVLIGTSTYEDEHLPDLPAVRTTVADLAAELTDPTYGVIAPENCVTLVDESNISGIWKQLRPMMNQAEDLLLVYFAGHGLVGETQHDLYLALPQSEFAGPEFDSIEYNKLRLAILHSPARTKLLIIDCCFSGRATTDTMADDTTKVLGMLDVAGTYVLTSAPPNQVSLVLPNEKHTAFTGRMLTLLREGIPGGNELLTIEDIYRQLLSTMRAEGLPAPHKRETQTANLLALARNRAFAASAGPLLLSRAETAFNRGLAGKWVDAVNELRTVLDEQIRVIGATDRGTLLTRQRLGFALGGSGHPDEAVKLLRELYEDQLGVLDADDADVLRTRQYLAVSLGQVGAYPPAVTMLRVLLPDRRRVCGPEHEETLRTQHVLAYYLAQTGQTEESIALLKELICLRERVLGPADPRTIRTRLDLSVLDGTTEKEA